MPTRRSKPAASSEPTLSIREVVKQTGVPAYLLRIWETRYGWPRPARHANRYRAYALSLVPVLRAVREQLDRGRTIGDLLRDPQWISIMDAGSLPGIVRPKRAEPPRWSIIPLPQSGEARDLRAKLEAALEKGDDGMVAWVQAQAGRLHPRERGPAITEVMALWKKHTRPTGG